MMERVEEECISMPESLEQLLQNAEDTLQNPSLDQKALEVDAHEAKQGGTNLEVARTSKNWRQSANAPAEVPTILNSDENLEAEQARLDEAVRSIQPPGEKQQEDEHAKLESTSTDSDVDIEINVEDVDEEMPTVSKEKATAAAQVVKEENSGEQSAELVIREPVSHKCSCKDALSNKFSCTCGIMCPNIRSLSAHIYVFNKERKFQCDFCERHFPFISLLVNHLKNSHKNKRAIEVEPEVPTTGEGQRRSGRITNEPERYGLGNYRNN